MIAPELRQEDYLAHMLEAAQLAREYVAGMDSEAFKADRKTQQAVIMNPLVTGEAATQMANKRHPATRFDSSRDNHHERSDL